MSGYAQDMHLFRRKKRGHAAPEARRRYPSALSELKQNITIAP